MAFELILLSRARHEILDGIEWYEGREIGLGQKFLSEVENEINRILENPSIFPVSNESGSNFQKAVLKKFPFIILFTSSREKIFIHSVFNTHLDPNKKPLA